MVFTFSITIRTFNKKITDKKVAIKRLFTIFAPVIKTRKLNNYVLDT